MMHALSRPITLLLVFTFLPLLVVVRFALPSRAHGGDTTTRISVASDGSEGNQASSDTFISGNGRYVAFTSLASNLVVGDTNGVRDAFLHDRQTGTTTRVSISTSGAEANAPSSYLLSVNQDGRYIAFVSSASNLVPGDTNNREDIFVRDRIIGTTERISVADDESEANGASGFAMDFSADGRYITFLSDATNLVPNDTNGLRDAFVRDRINGTTTRVSVTQGGQEANGASSITSISADGRYIVLTSGASNFVASDTNNASDIFLVDRTTGSILRVSVASSGLQANDSSGTSSISENGRFVAYSSLATNLVSNDLNGTRDIFVWDGMTGVTERVSVSSGGGEGNGFSEDADISADGRYIAYVSFADNLVPGDNNIFCEYDGDGDYNENCADTFVYDRLTDETILISVSSTGVQGNGTTPDRTMSDDGSLVAFDAAASNLVPGDTNFYCDNDGNGTFIENCSDVFVREWMVLTSTPTPTATPSATSTTMPTATSTPTTTPVPPATNTPPPGATLTPTQTATDAAVFVPLVMRQHAFATPVPTTPTPTRTPPPMCEGLDHEPNNVFLEADNNLPLCTGTVVSGSVAPTTDVNDIYRMTVVEPGPIVIRLTNLPAGADYDLYLYDARGGSGQIAVSNTVGSANEEIRITVPNGRYYIRVVSLQYAGTNTYQLRWLRE